MRNVKMLIAVGGALLCVASAGAGTLPSHLNILTFSGSVALPRISLPAGSYTFELADPFGSSDVVVVRSGDRRKVFYLGLTQKIARPGNLPVDRTVTFGESAHGVPPPITAWYPIGESLGYQFLYPRR
jgi:hypothetical protein